MLETMEDNSFNSNTQHSEIPISFELIFILKCFLNILKHTGDDEKERALDQKKDNVSILSNTWKPYTHTPSP